jgi:Domain of unknown function (DUF4390)
MLVCAKCNSILSRARAPISRTLVVGMLLGAGVALASGFKVSSAQPRAVGQTLFLDGTLDLLLSAKVEEAVGKGIPIEILLDVRLYRERPLIWDAKVASWTLRRELRYHALSGQYLVGGSDTARADRESSNSLSEALLELGTLDDLALTLPAPLAPNADYRVDVRVALDIEALPSLLRPVAYTSRAWDLNSGWTTWKVQR